VGLRLPTLACYNACPFPPLTLPSCLHLFLPVLTFSLLVSPFRSTQSRSPKWSLVISTLHFRGLALQSPGVSSRARRIIPRSLNSCSLLFYLSNVRPSVDLLAVLLNYVLHKARYQPIASDCLLPHDIFLALPFNSHCNVQSQGFGVHHHGYPKEPPNIAMGFNATVQSHCFPLLMDSALNMSIIASVDIPSSASQINPSHFHLSHPPATTSAPIPQPPLNSPTDVIDPPTSAIAVSNPDAFVDSGPPRNTSSGVIACRQWCVIALPWYPKMSHSQAYL